MAKVRRDTPGVRRSAAARSRANRTRAAKQRTSSLMGRALALLPFTEAQLQARFDLIRGLGCVQEIDMWVNDAPDNWLPYLEGFLQQAKE